MCDLKLVNTDEVSAEKAMAKEDFPSEQTARSWVYCYWTEAVDWSKGMQLPSVPIYQFSMESWCAQPATEDGSAGPTAQPTGWVGTTTE